MKIKIINMIVKSITITMIATSAFFVLFLSESFANKVKILNNTDDKIYVFFRGKGASTHHTETINPNTVVPFQVNQSALEGKPVFEVIAATSGGDPDWKLLGGVCSNLDRDKNYTLIVEKTVQGIKTSCTALEE